MLLFVLFFSIYYLLLLLLLLLLILLLLLLFNYLIIFKATMRVSNTIKKTIRDPIFCFWWIKCKVQHYWCVETVYISIIRKR